MAIDQITPRSRRAILAGAVGGLATAAVGLVHAPSVRAGVDGDVVLDAVNTGAGTTEIDAVNSNPALRVVGGGVGIQAGGDIGVDAGGDTIGVSAVSDGVGAFARSRGNGMGVIGHSTNGVAGDPPASPKTGVYGVAQQDASSRGVYGLTASGHGARGQATTGVGVAGVADSGTGVDGRSNSGIGVAGVGPSGLIPNPLVFIPGVYGVAGTNPGVYGHSQLSQGLRGDSDVNDGVFGNADAQNVAPHTHVNNGAGVHGHGGQAGVLGTHDTGFGVQASSVSAPALFASNQASTVAAIVADGGPGTAIHGHANDTGPNQLTMPPSPALTGLFGSAAGSGIAIAASSESGLALSAQSSLGAAIRAHGQLDGVIGESATGRTGLVGYSGGGSAPAGPAKTGVYGEATQDAGARGVSGFTLAGQGVHGDATTGQGVAGAATTGQGVKGTATTGDAVLGQSASGKSVRGIATTGQGVSGEATTGTGVKAVATTGLALDVTGRAFFSRSGRAAVPANRTYVDVTVPGGLSVSAIVFATLQYGLSGVWVTAARPNYPTSGKVRIFLNKVASTTTTINLAWFVVG